MLFLQRAGRRFTLHPGDVFASRELRRTEAAAVIDELLAQVSGQRAPDPPLKSL
jgi:hypothetical protein